VGVDLLSYTDSVMGAWSFVGGYDSLNRLTGGSATSGQYQGLQMSWSYDSFGNRLTQAGNGGMNIVSQFANDAAGNPHNQVTQTNARGVTSLPQYDAAGEMQTDGANAYLYDAEGRVCAVAAAPIGGIANMTGYLYNAEGKRVAKGTISSFSCNMMTNGFTATNEFVLGQGGEQLSELARDENGTMAWQHTNVYAAGVLMASYDNNGTHFLLNDWLGTRRAQTNFAGVLEQTCASLPFGDALNCTGSLTAPTEHHFTAKERDTESGNDYMFARYYNSATGRFLSPDWSAKEDPVPYAKLDDPQTLNLYSYVGNNPIGRADADGHCFPFCLAVAGGGVLASESPLAAIGPVGWTVIGVTAVGVAAYATYQHFHQEDAPPAPPPAATPHTDEGNPHAPGDVPNGQKVVRGGQGEMPSSSDPYSGAQGATVEEAGKGVPHGTIRPATAGDIRAAGGQVRPAPEPAYPGGPINGQHVNVTGGQSAFGPPQANPAPRPQRVPSAPKPPKPTGDSQ
jgi:RHS repeat-associated protein